MPSLKRARPIDEEPEESGFGLETEHFYNKSDSDDERPDYGIPLNDDGRLRLRADIVLDEPRYAGVKGSRKSAFEEEDSEGSEEKDEDDDIVSDESSSHSDESSAEETDKLSGLQAGGLFDNELEALQREYADLQKQEGEMLKALKGHGDDDVQKSRAVSHQKALWERALEFRICLQKSFASANCLPQGIAKLALCQADTNVEKGYCNLKASSLGTLGLLSDILEDLISQNPVITDTAPSDNDDKKFQENGEARDDIDPVDAAWERMDSLYARIIPFRNASVDRWQRKTQLSTGAAASRNKLKALNQSISQQIKNFMRDPSRLVQRMQLRQSSAVHVLGMPRQKISEAAHDHKQDVVKDTGLEIDNEEGGVECLNPELYDDSEFYQQLLQEFLESSDPTSLGLSINGSRKLLNKRRKVVDRRASKGRKIRYHVHEKIVNFMAPEPRNLPPMAEKLFMNLFGQGKVSL